MKTIFTFIIAFGVAACAFAQDTTKPVVTWSGFVDTYYMYDFTSPGGNEKSHPFTQPARNNEFNVNLAHIEVDVNSQDFRGVLALHTGTAVQLNYAAEAKANPLTPLIHQAWAGYRVAEGVWIDAGIYPAPYGFEGWISRDNKTYTRSIVADYSPYYQTGIRASWQISETFNAGINLINGWQNIAETNTDKALGLTIGYTPSESIGFIYNNFIGNEQPTGTPGATRFFNDLCARITVTKDLQFDLVADFGMQKKDTIDASWMGASLVGRLQFTPKFAIAARGEYYKDEHQIILATGTNNGFDGFGVSANTDFQLSSALLWRIEYRLLQCKSPVFPSKDGFSDKSDFIVTSLAISLQ